VPFPTPLGPEITMGRISVGTERERDQLGFG